MNDPIARGGGDAVRFAVSTVPTVIATSVALALPIGVWANNPGAGVSTGFSIAIILGMTVEYIRRGSLSASRLATRRLLFSLIHFFYGALPMLAGIGLLLGIVAVTNGFGRPGTSVDHIVAVIGLVFAVIAVLTSLGLIALLRSAVWARYRSAAICD